MSRIFSCCDTFPPFFFFLKEVIKYNTLYKIDFSLDKYILQTEFNGRNFPSENKPHLSVEVVLVTKHIPFHLQSTMQTLNNGLFFFFFLKSGL